MGHGLWSTSVTGHRDVDACSPPLPLEAPPQSGAPSEVARLHIAGRECRLLCVDGVLPTHKQARPGARPRLCYANHEIAHFELGGHSFALVDAELAEASAPAQPPGGTTAALADVRELLTNRELQIVQLICMGCLTKQVADRLRISEFTVRSYLKTIYCKLGVRSRGAMVYRYAQAFQRSEAAPEPARCQSS